MAKFHLFLFASFCWFNRPRLNRNVSVQATSLNQHRIQSTKSETRNNFKITNSNVPNLVSNFFHLVLEFVSDKVREILSEKDRKFNGIWKHLIFDRNEERELLLKGTRLISMYSGNSLAVCKGTLSRWTNENLQCGRHPTTKISGGYRPAAE